ncbi:uncharacterized protein LOC127252225 [Andrographis paniculata]|uniref:uncharacterized protein LOC127252225 n=1 Tax=Andrographis paniculata TaxID=175694 RepID=UPI0021E93DAE|nr:uncharacterized protein LOC127252225 [Andrographis paniculata]
MIQVLEFPKEVRSLHQLDAHNPFKTVLRKSSFHPRSFIALKSTFFSPVCIKTVNQGDCSVVRKDAFGEREKYNAFPHVQTLRNFPKEDLSKKVVMVRFDPMILVQGKKEVRTPFPENALYTIKYLYEAGAKVILVSCWSETATSRSLSNSNSSAEYISDFLSSMLQLKVVPVNYASGYLHSDEEDIARDVILLLENIFHFKGERSNCSNFAKELASGVDILVNDAFSESHKVLASTVGIATFCSACIAGFYFEECIYKLKNIMNTTEKPYMVVIGGAKLADKAAAMRFLASTCDGLFFVGKMSFQIMHAMGWPVPLHLIEIGSVNEARGIVEVAKSRNIPVVLPTDVWCIKEHTRIQTELFSVCSIPEGWQPVDIGSRSVHEMLNLLSQCKGNTSRVKKILWIGPLISSSSKQEKGGTLKLAEALDGLSSCNVTFAGKTGFSEFLQKTKFRSSNKFLKNAVVLWEVLKGSRLPGLMALDRAYPLQIDWSVAYNDPTRPLVVDIGSGNGLFLFGMSTRIKDVNFLGLEINTKLVDQCVNNVQRLASDNVHFVATNATSTFRSIVSTYPGELHLVSIQCPNPDFNKPEYRWRMLQKSLIEAIGDVLMVGGKVFLQSDVQAVALKMKIDFLRYGKGRLVLMDSPEERVCNEKSGWLEDNPFGVPSDWEQHVLERGHPMYRILLLKVETEDD